MSKIEGRRGKDGGPAEPVPAENVARIEAGGPIQLSGDIEIVSNDGEVVFEGRRVVLCRCGRSWNKPFCDDRHTEAEYEDSGDLEEAKPKPESFAPGGKLRVTLRPNGSLRMEGMLEIRGADGLQSSFHGERVSLCRCGRSQKKPFCDGTHRETGFVAD